MADEFSEKALLNFNLEDEVSLGNLIKVVGDEEHPIINTNYLNINDCDD